ncbi:MAG: hypothetical protein NUV31_07285, partial [Dehalococcoidales bacterium]|nr:hypothetical protein [Dehalococcoidales bacterium]
MDAEKYLELKAELLVDGVNASEIALQEVGSKYKEQNHGLFGWDFEDHAGINLPDDFLLPDGTVIQFRMNRSSPYFIDLKQEKTILTRNGIEICQVRWIPRPTFYRLRTSNGNLMVKIGQI